MSHIEITPFQLPQELAELLEAARQIAQDDPHALHDYAGFERVMWHDDADRNRLGLGRDEYRDILRLVYKTLTRRR